VLRPDAETDFLAFSLPDAIATSLSGNSTLMRVWRTLEPFSRTYITLGVPGADRRRIADEHLPVLEALRSRDPALAEAVLHHHFDEAAAGLARRWTDEASPAAPSSTSAVPTAAGARPT